jgi:hypoxanthine-guanine phosphoribosyltransferase
MNDPKWSCYCGHLNRLKFVGVRCPICRTECFVKEPPQHKRTIELAEWVASDYHNLTPTCIAILAAHTMNLAHQLKA